jgi:exopolyphosphatase / guanosine-5'-triphosphate,3'-diphosphate pyrophosphatase
VSLRKVSETPSRRKTDRPQRRIAAIDIGTNSIHMIIAESFGDGYRVIDKEKDMVQLGRDSLEGRPLTPEAIERGVKSLKMMSDIARRWKVDEIVAVATSAVREAPNRRRFLSAAERGAGIKIRVISGEQEADYIYRAVRSAIDFHGGTALSIDVGGGSVEMIVGTSAEVFFTQSVPLGALRISQKFHLDRAASSADIKECRSFVRKTLKKVAGQIAALGFDFTVGTSGTILTLAELAAQQGSAGSTVTSGLRWLSRSRLQELIEALAPLDVAERVSRFGIDAKRAETIVGGAVVLREVMDGVKTDQIRSCDVALREGIVETRLDALRHRKGAVRDGSVRRNSTMALADQTDVDLTHAHHVAALALRIFDQTTELHMLQTGERELLEYATLLHEAGMHVSYQSHHKHSYYLISHAGLRGFTADQVAIIANVARYHRKSPPAVEHSNFAELTPTQRKVVMKLSAILRIADALDRGRQGAVRDVAVVVDDESVLFRIRPRGDAAVEYGSASKKGKFFGEAFDRKVRFSLSRRS